MKYNATSKLLIAAICSLAYAQAFAVYTYTVESRTPGANYTSFTQSGLATTTAKSTGLGLTGTGVYYGGQTTGLKAGDWTFNVGATYGGYYDVFGCWPVNPYTGGMNLPTWTVHNAGTDVAINLSQASGGNAWNALASGVKLNASTAYSVHLQTNPDSVANKRTYFDSVKWTASTPTIGAYSGPANGATGIATTGAGNDLYWAAGNYDSFFDVFLDTSATPTTLVGANLAGTTLTFDPDSLGLLGGTTYFWTVKAKNVDVTTAGATWSFTTIAIPEPSTAVVSILGGLGLAAWSRRRTV